MKKNQSDQPVTIGVLREELQKKGDRMKDHLDTVYEDFESKQALMAESLIAIEDNLGLVKEDVSVMKKDIDYIKLDISLIRRDLKTKVSRDELPQNLLARRR